METVVTQHGKKRLKERVGLNKKSAEKNADKAFQEGIKHSEVSGSLRKYFDALYLQNRSANNIRIYGEKVYLFGGNKLITVLNLPNKYKSTVAKIRKNKNGH